MTLAQDELDRQVTGRLVGRGDLRLLRETVQTIKKHDGYRVTPLWRLLDALATTWVCRSRESEIMDKHRSTEDESFRGREAYTGAGDISRKVPQSVEVRRFMLRKRR